MFLIFGANAPGLLFENIWYMQICKILLIVTKKSEI